MMAKLRDADGEGWPPYLAVFDPADWPQAASEWEAGLLWRCERARTARRYGHSALSEVRAMTSRVART